MSFCETEAQRDLQKRPTFYKAVQEMLFKRVLKSQRTRWESELLVCVFHDANTRLQVLGFARRQQLRAAMSATMSNAQWTKEFKKGLTADAARHIWFAPSISRVVSHCSLTQRSGPARSSCSDGTNEKNTDISRLRPVSFDRAEPICQSRPSDTNEMCLNIYLMSRPTMIW